MGHANVLPLSKLFVQMIHDHETTTIGETLDKAVEMPNWKDDTDETMVRGQIGTYLMEVINGLLKPQRFTPRSKPVPVIEPHDMDDRQTEIYSEFVENGEDFESWSVGENGEIGQYDIFDTIMWKFTPEWASRYPDLPLMEHLTL